MDDEKTAEETEPSCSNTPDSRTMEDDQSYGQQYNNNMSMIYQDISTGKTYHIPSGNGISNQFPQHSEYPTDLTVAKEEMESTSPVPSKKDIPRQFLQHNEYTTNLNTIKEEMESIDYTTPEANVSTTFTQNIEFHNNLDIAKKQMESISYDDAKNGEVMPIHHVEIHENNFAKTDILRERLEEDPLKQATSTIATQIEDNIQHDDIQHEDEIELPYTHPTKYNRMTYNKEYNYEGKEKAYRKHACKYCDFRSYAKNSLERHVRSWHEAETYKCNMCRHTTRQKDNMNKHFIRKHLVEYLQQARKCNMCGKPSSKLRLLIKNNPLLDMIGTCTGLRCKTCSFMTCLPYCMKSHGYLEHGYDEKQSIEMTETVKNWRINQIQDNMPSICKLCTRINLLDFHYKNMIQASKDGIQHTSCKYATNMEI